MIISAIATAAVAIGTGNADAVLVFLVLVICAGLLSGVSLLAICFRALQRVWVGENVASSSLTLIRSSIAPPQAGRAVSR